MLRKPWSHDAIECDDAPGRSHHDHGHGDFWEVVLHQGNNPAEHSQILQVLQTEPISVSDNSSSDESSGLQRSSAASLQRILKVRDERADHLLDQALPNEAPIVGDAHAPHQHRPSIVSGLREPAEESMLSRPLSLRRRRRPLPRPVLGVAYPAAIRVVVLPDAVRRHRGLHRVGRTPAHRLPVHLRRGIDVTAPVFEEAQQTQWVGQWLRATRADS
mmetsp:Transcript_58511/g.151202  ORF Transcript_58511/g.151202 Transcript_58511/m.151202 type:complete len:217 (+) Transcript_58511:203-853(+)